MIRSILSFFPGAKQAASHMCQFKSCAQIPLRLENIIEVYFCEIPYYVVHIVIRVPR